MTNDEALCIADEALIAHTSKKSLSDLERIILSGSLENKTYEKIAKEINYNPNYIKEEGANLWEKLSAALGEKVSKKSFRGAFEKRLKLKKVASEPPEPILYNSRTWTGRGSLVKKLATKLKEQTRILWLTGISGVGKTALAECIAVNAWKETSSFCWISLPIFEGQIPNFTTGATEILAKLGDIDIAPQERTDSKRICNRLVRKLQSHPYWIQLDSIERLLDNKKDDFAFYDNYWLIFFRQCLTEKKFPSRLLLTSQALPTEVASFRDNYSNFWHNITLSGLSASKEHNEQLEFFSKKGIKIAKSNSYILSKIGQIYEGHPLALQVISGEIVDDYDNDVDQYWEVNRQEFEQLTRQMSFPRLSSKLYNEELQQRIRQRIENSLLKLPENALSLLCLSSAYRRAVTKYFWLEMLPNNITEDQKQQAYLRLKDRALIEKQGIKHNQQLIRQHNLIRDIAYDLLRKNKSIFKDAERKAGGLWLSKYKPPSDTQNIENVRGYLEALYHFYQSEDWNKIGKIIRNNMKEIDRLQQWGYYSEMIDLYQFLLSGIKIPEFSICSIRLGNAYYFIGRHLEAQSYWEDGLSLAREFKDYIYEGRALGNLSLIFFHQAKYNEAIEINQQYLDLSRSINDTQGEAHALGGLGTSHQMLGNYHEAIKFYEQELEIRHVIEDFQWEVTNLSNTGDCYIELEEYKKAIEYFEKSIAKSREYKIIYGQIAGLNSLSIALRKLGNYDDSLSSCQESFQLACENKNLFLKGRALIELGINWMNLSNFEMASKKLEEALKIFIEDMNCPDDEAETLKVLAELHYRWGKKVSGLHYCEQALVIAKDLNGSIEKECLYIKSEFDKMD